MHSPLALFQLHALASVRNAVIPAASGAFAAIALVLFRSGRASEQIPTSLMNFSSLGALRCVCGTEHFRDGAADRRTFCRSCGCEIVRQNQELLSRQMTSREIKAMTRNLRRAAIRASHLELPPTIKNVHELHRYLDGAEPKTVRFASAAVAVEHTQIH